VRDWLNRCDTGAQLLYDVLMAAGRACVNAVEHGDCGDPDGTVQLRAVAVANQLSVRVADNGSWKISEPMGRPLSLDAGHDADGRPMLTAHDGIDLTNCMAFASALTAAVAEASPVMADLTDVEHLDSGAINALFAHADQLRLIVRPVLLPALRICGLATVSAVTTADHIT
jgi:anti-anti-sigma regulatory factor